MARLTVVVIDNDGDTLEFMEVLLTGAGYHAVVSYDEAQAAKLIRREQPMMAILDLQMAHPDSGLRILRQLRADERTALIPIILYSAERYYLLSHRMALRELGADILVKPFAPHELLAKLPVAA